MPAADVPTPSDAALARLDTDAWASLLTAVRRAVQARGPASDEERALVESPAGRLVGSRGHRQVATVLAATPALWEAVSADPAVAAVAEQLDSTAAPEGGGVHDAVAGSTGGGHDRSSADRDKQRVRRAREERDAWRRRAEGADARAAQLTSQLQAAEQRIAELEAELAAVRAQLEDHADERARAVERERRRRDAEVARLEQAVSDARRELEAQRQAARRRTTPDTGGGGAPRSGQQADEDRATAVDDDGADDRFVPGRPSRLPNDVVAGTTQAASLLLHPGRLVLVDGYNVSRQHRSHLDLETQRSWLVQLLATAAAIRRIRPVVVFDGERSGGGRPGVGGREVEVRFTPTGITADDELVLAVEATDEPVVVVTDDRELTARVRASGADVLGTVPFLGAATSAGP